MNSPYSLAQAVDSSRADGSSATASSGTSRKSGIGRKASTLGSKTASWTTPPSGVTFATLTGQLCGGPSMLSRPDSPAPHSQLPGRISEGMTRGTSGPPLSESFARFDPDSSSWRTAQICLFTPTLEPFSETWPKQGSMRSGRCYLRRTAGRTTSERGSGFWPTPNQSMLAGFTRDPMKLSARTSGGHRRGHEGNELLRRVLFPTPSAVSYGYNQGGAKPTGPVRPSLETMARRGMWPTPTSVTATGGAAICKWGGSGSRKMAQKMCRPGELNGALNPTWVEWLMGWPLGWTDLQPLAMDKFRSWLHSHSDSL